jgi:hypothetical protein
MSPIDARLLNQVPTMTPIESRQELLQLVVEDLVATYAAKREEAGDTEEVIDQFSVLDAVEDLLYVATHRAAHAAVFKSKDAFKRIVREVLEVQLNRIDDCIEVELDEQAQKMLS